MDFFTGRNRVAFKMTTLNITDVGEKLTREEIARVVMHALANSFSKATPFLVRQCVNVQLLNDSKEIQTINKIISLLWSVHLADIADDEEATVHVDIRIDGTRFIVVEEECLNWIEDWQLEILRNI